MMFVYEYTTGYLKNHWTKHRHVCTHFHAFSMTISNMSIMFNKSDKLFFLFNFMKKVKMSSATRTLMVPTIPITKCVVQRPPFNIIPNLNLWVRVLCSQYIEVQFMTV